MLNCSCGILICLYRRLCGCLRGSFCGSLCGCFCRSIRGSLGRCLCGSFRRSIRGSLCGSFTGNLNIRDCQERSYRSISLLNTDCDIDTRSCLSGKVYAHVSEAYVFTVVISNTPIGCYSKCVLNILTELKRTALTTCPRLAAVKREPDTLILLSAGNACPTGDREDGGCHYAACRERILGYSEHGCYCEYTV